MSSDIIYLLIYNSITATVIASVALIISLHVLHRQYLARSKKVVTQKKRKTAKRKSLKFSFPIHVQALVKDFIILLLIALIGIGFFVFNAQAAEWEVSKYLGLGVRYIKYTALDSYKNTGAIVLESSGVPEERDNIASSTDAVLEEEESAAIEEKVVQKEIVQKSPPKIILSPPPPAVIAPLVIKDPPKPENSEAIGPAGDAAVSALSYYGSALIEGGLLSFSVIVSNKGEKDMEASFNTQIHIDEGNDGWTELHLSRIETRALKISENETKIWKSAWMAKVGTHRAYVCTDTENTLLEMNEKNNCAEIVFTVKGHETSGDLVVEELKMIPAAPSLGYNVAFSARVINKALSPAKRSYVYLTIDDNNALSYKKYVPSLSSNEFEKIEWGTVWKATTGTHSYKACADGGEEVLETNEENNCSTGTFFVAQE